MAIFLLVDGVMQTERAICEVEGNGQCSRLPDFPVASLVAIFLNEAVSSWNGHFDLNVAFFLCSALVVVSITLYVMEDIKAKMRGKDAGAEESTGAGLGSGAEGGGG